MCYIIVKNNIEQQVNIAYISFLSLSNKLKVRQALSNLFLCVMDRISYLRIIYDGLFTNPI